MPVKIDPLLGLPEKYSDWRDDQWTAVNAITKSDKPFFLADLPTGVGKSLIGVGAHKILNRRTIYLCGTKQLQDQLMRDFGDMAVTLKGRANYPCAIRESEFPDVSCEDCSVRDPRRCDHYGQCQYYQQKELAAVAPLAVLNNAYFLNEANGFSSVFSGAGLLIADEVDALDNALLGYVELRITSKQLDRYGLQPPDHPDVKESWLSWIDGAVDSLDENSNSIGTILNRQSDFKKWGKAQLENNRLKKSMEKLRDKLAFIQSEVDWSWIFYSQSKNGQTEWVFKPVNVGKYAKRYLWDHAEFKVGMSGTIFSPDITCRELGIDNCDYMRCDSPFPVENRPIYFKPVVSLSRNTMFDALPVLRDEIDRDLLRYPDRKVLIHTVSYEIRNYLMQGLSCQERLMTHESGTRELALEEFKKSRAPSVMLSPSFDRGVDLREEDNCGCQMICKMPYLSLGDPQVSAKVKTPGGWTWYALKAVQTLGQMTGRSVRSTTQKCDTIIYDGQFSRLRAQMKDTIPPWWQSAIIEQRPALNKTAMLI
jgi:Rad3-related DNA helicase